jgi:GSCFA family
MSDPYENLPANGLWRNAIADKNLLESCELWKPKHPLKRSHKVATFGSCFAQHLGCALNERGYAWFEAEPSPDIFVPAIQNKYNYGIFSARTGNIYTVAALRQWVSWAIGAATPPEEIWETKGRFFDPFRPSIEPNGFATPEELLASRRMVLRAMLNVIEHSDWFVFTFARIEACVNSAKGYVYAMCPDTITGEFDGNNHLFKTYTIAEISADLNWVIEAICNLNNKIRFLFTVSPVPMIPTASGKHVPTATTSSKALLRAVARKTETNLEIVDYFPSYEILAGELQGLFYEPNKQSLSKLGITFEMDFLFTCFKHAFGDMPAVIEPAPVIARNPREFWSNVRDARNALRDFI